MNALELLMSRRWILKSEEPALYYKVRDEIGSYREFISDKLGWQLIVNPLLVKLEKIPGRAENWMGIQAFNDVWQYVFFCMTLMFLEEKEVEGQFVLSELTESIQANYRRESIDWTVYHFRRHLIRVLRFCEEAGIVRIDDGTEDRFAEDSQAEVLYRNTGSSRYFMRNFHRNLETYRTPEDFERSEWNDLGEDRGILRRHRVYRSIFSSPGLYRSGDNEEDFLYIRNFRRMLAGDFEERLDCELHVHRNSAFLVLGEDCRMGRFFPEENTVDHSILLFDSVLLDHLESGDIEAGTDEQIVLTDERFRLLLEETREKYGSGFAKAFREMTGEEFYRTMHRAMLEREWIGDTEHGVIIRPVAGKICGIYPDDYKGNTGGN